MAVCFRISLLVLISILSGVATSVAEECVRDRRLMESAKTWMKEGQYLLGTFQFSEVTARACTPELKQSAQLFLAMGLYNLGEQKASLNQLRLLKETGVSCRPGQSGINGCKWRRIARLAEEVLEFPDGDRIDSDAELTSADHKSLEIWKHRRDGGDPRKPWLGGLLSAVLPGAGQVYAGAYQSAVVSFVLNALFLSATLELSKKELPSTAAAAGLVFSVTYVGNIVNAVRSTQQTNEAYWRPIDKELRGKLFPELEP